LTEVDRSVELYAMPLTKETKHMTQKSPAKVKCERINQIAIVVKDLEVVAENFWKILGIGPWSWGSAPGPFTTGNRLWCMIVHTTGSLRGRGSE
jgi:hypothetical protein